MQGWFVVYIMMQSSGNIPGCCNKMVCCIVITIMRVFLFLIFVKDILNLFYSRAFCDSCLIRHSIMWFLFLYASPSLSHIGKVLFIEEIKRDYFNWKTKERQKRLLFGWRLLHIFINYVHVDKIVLHHCKYHQNSYSYKMNLNNYASSLQISLEDKGKLTSNNLACQKNHSYQMDGIPIFHIIKCYVIHLAWSWKTIPTSTVWKSAIRFQLSSDSTKIQLN